MKQGNAAKPDLFSDEFYQDPYPVYAWLREHDPVHWSDQFEAWIITRYDDVSSILRDYENYSNAGRQLDLLQRLPGEGQENLCPLKDFYRAGGLINSDPPRHTRLRRLLQRAFTAKAMEKVRPRVQDLVDGMLDRHCESGQMEIIGELAKPLPSQVIAEVLGAPEKDRPIFGVWADQIGLFLSAPKLTQELALKSQDAVLHMRDYFRGLLAQRRIDGKEDVLTVMAGADETGDALNEQEILASCQNLLLAGQNTTVHLIANTLAMLLQHPDQLKMVLDDPSLLTGAIEETLRFNGSAHVIRRRAKKDIELRGKLIRADQAVIATIGAANHDPEKFDRADEFDIKRVPGGDKARHIAFGVGIHFCIGAPLAWVEAEVAVGSILNRMRDLRLKDGQLRWLNLLVERGLQRLDIEFTPSRPLSR